MDLDAFLFSEGGVQSLAFFTHMLNMSYSETNLVDVHLDVSGIKVSLEMNLSNPSPFPLTINTIRFMVHCADHPDLKLGRGESSQVVTLEPHAIDPIPLTVTITTEAMVHIYSHHFQLSQFILELTLDIKNIEIETSISGIAMAITLKHTMKIPLHYDFINGT
jgi:LEA14-like dessication related protein